MSAKKHFTTNSPKTLFSVIQFARLANLARQTVFEKWQRGEIQATALNARSQPLFDTSQLAKLKDNRFKGEKLT